MSSTTQKKKKAAPKAAAPVQKATPKVARPLQKAPRPPFNVVRALPPPPQISALEIERRKAQGKKDQIVAKTRLSNKGHIILSRANENLLRSTTLNTMRGVSGNKMKAIRNAHMRKMDPEMKRMANFLFENAKEDPLMTAFAMQYANPFAHYGVRFLGPVENSTGVYSSYRTVDIPINTTNGRFAACLQPKIGNAQSLSEWQLYLVDGSATGWDDGDWNLETNYQVNSPAGDLRVDVNYASIATVQTVKVTYKELTGLSQAITAFTDAQYQPADDANDFGVTTTATATGIVINFPAGPPQAFKYWVFWSTAQAANTAGAVLTTFGGGVSSLGFSPTASLATTAAAAATQAYAYITGNAISDGTAGTITISSSGGTTSTTLINAFSLEIRPMDDSDIDFGSFSSVQPVAAGIWAEWVGPLIENAGNITSALGPVNSVNQHWLSSATNAANQFRPQYWEDYTQLQPGNNSKVYPDGKIDQGAVAMWRPQRPEDQELFKPSVSNSTTYGPMYIAGQYNTSTGTIPAGAIVRLFTIIVFQYETTNRLLPVCSNPLVYANAVTAAENLLHALSIPIAAANGFHEWWAQMVKDVGAFFTDLGGVVGMVFGNFVRNMKPQIGFKGDNWSVSSG